MSKFKKIILYSILAVVFIGSFLVYYFSVNRENNSQLTNEEGIIKQEKNDNSNQNSVNNGINEKNLDYFDKQNENVIVNSEATNQFLSELPENLKNLTFTDKYQKEDYEKALEFEAKIKENPEDYYNYNSAGFWWKGLGDLSSEVLAKESLTQGNSYYNRAAEIYAFAGKKFEAKKVYQPYQNLANVYIALKNYQKAEEALKNAINLAPEEGILYVKLVELYKDLMNKSQEEIIAVYESALRQEYSQPDVIYPAYAYYLCGIGKVAEALEKTKIDCGSF